MKYFIIQYFIKKINYDEKKRYEKGEEGFC